MRTSTFYTLYLLSLVTLLQAQTPRVLIIGIDGCRPDALETATTPNLDALIANGFYSPDALNDDITFSGPGWSAILTGVRSDKHGVTNNSFSGSNFSAYPSILERLEGLDPNYVTASIVHWGPINSQIVNGTADYERIYGTDQEIENDAVAYLQNNDPDLLFLHFDDVDHAGHASGFSPSVSAYIDEIEQVDAHIGSVMTAIENRPNRAAEDWLILVVPDHGGIGFSHGGNSIEERRVFFVASGDRVPQSVQLKETTTIPIFDCLDNTTELTFDGENDRVTVPETPLFNFGANQDFTVECRVRTSQAADVSIVGDKDWDSGVFPGFVLSFKLPSGPEWKVNIGDGSNRSDLNVSGNIADGEWHSLAVTFDRDGVMSAYEDGVFKGATSIASVGNITTTGGLFFGADVDNGYDYTGALAEVRVWDGLLPAASIEAWRCKQLNNEHPQYSQLLGYWPLDEGAGTVANDQSTNTNNGVIAGASWESPTTIALDDYSNTPRLVDIPVTALHHLCVAVDPLWNLDGVSRITTCVAMPVSWNTFEVKREGDFKVAISWSTAMESGNRGFVVERSKNGLNWVGISELITPENSHQYAFTDDWATTDQTWYYRIRQMDHDGTRSFSSVKIIYPTKTPKSLEIYPNPVHTNLTVKGSALEQGKEWEILDQLDQLHLKGRVLQAGELTIDATQLAPGIYYFWLKGERSQAFVVQ